MRVEGTVGLVTGGASGLGEGVARMLCSRGGRVAIVDLPESRGQLVADDLGSGALFAPADVTDPVQVADAVARVAAEFERIDLCVNCAGISPAHRMVRRDGTLFPLEMFRQAVEVNLIGLFDVLRHVAGVMGSNEPGDDGERGLIINVASIAAFEGQVGQAAYSASKGGVIALTLPLARDLAEWGIRVVTICPGVMDTAMVSGLGKQRSGPLIDLPVFPKRLGTPDDFARLVAAVMENTLLNGEHIRLDTATRLR